MSAPFRCGCHSRAIFGKRTARLFVTETRSFAQKGHFSLLPTCRSTLRRNSWSGPFGHFHQTRHREWAVTSAGVSSALRAGCHRRATPGARAASVRDHPWPSPRQCGHPRPRRRLLIVASKACRGLRRHRHQSFTVEPGVTSHGVSGRLRRECHSSASLRWRAASAVVTEGRFPVQKGQPTPRTARPEITASHSWSGPFAHFHQAFRSEPATTSHGVRLPFLVGCHSRATRRLQVASALVRETRLPAQKGQPPPERRVRCSGLACQSWSGPRSHFHQSFWSDPRETCSGRRAPFRVGWNSRTRRGYAARLRRARLLGTARSYHPRGERSGVRDETREGARAGARPPIARLAARAAWRSGREPRSSAPGPSHSSSSAWWSRGFAYRPSAPPSDRDRPAPLRATRSAGRTASAARGRSPLPPSPCDRDASPDRARR